MFYYKNLESDLERLIGVQPKSTKWAQEFRDFRKEVYRQNNIELWIKASNYHIRYCRRNSMFRESLDTLNKVFETLDLPDWDYTSEKYLSLKGNTLLEAGALRPTSMFLFLY